MRYLVQLVLLMAAIMPQMTVFGAQVGQPVDSSRVEMRGVADHSYLQKRRIFVRYQFTGESFYYWGGNYVRLEDWFPAYFQTLAAQDGRVEVVVWGQDLKIVTEAQDYVANSGRYTPESRAQVPIGGMHAPTDAYVVTVKRTINRTKIGLSLKLGNDLNFGVNDHVKVTLEMTVQPWDILTGALQPGWIVKGEGSGLDGVGITSNSNKWWQGAAQGVAFKTSDVEQSLEGKAARKLCDGFFAHFNPTQPAILPVPVIESEPTANRISNQSSDANAGMSEPVEGDDGPKAVGVSGRVTFNGGIKSFKVTLNDDKTVHLQDEVKFYKADGTLAAQYKIDAISDDGKGIVTVKVITETASPADEAMNCEIIHCGPYCKD